MFKLRKNEQSDLEDATERMFAELNMFDVDTEEYKLRLEYLERLKALEPERAKKPSGDAWIQAASHILGIGIVTQFEKLNPFTSRALQFIPKK